MSEVTLGSLPSQSLSNINFRIKELWRDGRQRGHEREKTAAMILYKIIDNAEKISNETGLDFHDFDTQYKKFNNDFYICFKDRDGRKFVEKIITKGNFNIDDLIKNLKNNKGESKYE